MKICVLLSIVLVLGACSSYNEPSYGRNGSRVPASVFCSYYSPSGPGYYGSTYYGGDNVNYYGSYQGYGSYYQSYYKGYYSGQQGYQPYPTSQHKDFVNKSYYAEDCDETFSYISSDTQLTCNTRGRTYYAAFCAGKNSKFIPGSARECNGLWAGSYYASRCAGYYSPFIPIDRRVECRTHDGGNYSYYAARCAGYYSNFVPLDRDYERNSRGTGIEN